MSLEAQQKLLETKAANNVRRVIQKVRLATPENFEELQNEIFDTMEKELENLGDSHDKVQQECDKAIEAGQKRIEQILQKREEDEVKYQSHREVMAELGTLIDVLHMKTNDLRQAAGLEEGTEFQKDAVDTVNELMAEMSEELKSFSVSCNELLQPKAAEMKLPTLPSEIKKGWTEVAQKMDKAKQEALKAGVQAKVAVTKVVEAEKKAMLEEAKLLFIDKLGDIKVAVAAAEMTIKQVEDMADPLLKYKASEERLQVCKDVEAALPPAQESIDAAKKMAPEPDDEGVDEKIKGEFKDWVTSETKRPVIRLGQFERRLERARNIIARFRKDLTKVAAESAIDELKKPLLEKVAANAAKVNDLIAEVDKAIKEAEKKVEPFPKSHSLGIDERNALAADAEKAVEEAKTAAADCRAQICPIDDSLEESVKAKLKKAIETKVKMPLLKLGGIERRLTRVVNLVATFHKDTEKKRVTALSKVKADAMRVLRYAREVKKVDHEGLYKLIVSDGKGAVTKEKWLAFFASADKTIKGQGLPDAGEKVELPAEGLGKVFDGHCADGESSIPKEAFIAKVLSTFMQVCKSTIFTSDLSIKDGKKLRLLRVGEVLEALEGPVKETTAGLLRIRARAVNDKMEGWATVAGNAGTVLLKDCEAPASA